MVGRRPLRTYLRYTLFALACAAIWIWSPPVDAQTALDTSGALRADYFQSTRTLDNDRDLLGATAQLKGRFAPSDALAIRFDGRAGNASFERPGRAHAQLTEGYLAYETARWDWRIGKQVVAWGRADGINPTDVVSPRDYTVLLPFDEDQREGAWVASGSYALSPELGLTLLWKEGFEATTIAIPSGDRANYAFVQPSRGAGQFGVRLNRAGGEVDWSASLFHGRSLLPQAGPDQPTPGVLRLTYPTITMLGADMATNFAAFGTRFEAAYVAPDDTPPADAPGLRPNLYLVAGVDRTFFPRLNLNLQLFVRRTWQLPHGLALRWADAQGFNASTFMQQRSHVEGMTLRLSNAWLNDTLTAELFVQHFFRDGDTFVQPMVTYAFSDAVKGTAGGQYYAGDGPQFGPMKRNRGLFAELRYSF